MSRVCEQKGGNTDESQHIPQLCQTCVVCGKSHSMKRGGNKPRTREGCETCVKAVHIACWKEQEGDSE